jgi:flagellar hook capping protein FlgD
MRPSSFGDLLMRLPSGRALFALLAFLCLSPALRADDEVKKPEAKEEESSPALRIDYGTLSDVAEVEPNNTPAQANVLGCGNTFRPAAIAVQAVRDTDWISFSANAGQVITFGTDADGPTPIGDTRISILSSDGVTVLGTDDDGGPGRYSLLSICAPYTGTYYGRIAAFGSQTGTYMAFLTCSASSAPNDQCAGAIPLSCGAIDLSGTTANACPDYSPAEGGCTGFVANGRDVVYQVNAFAGDSLFLDYVQSTTDASIYVVSDCSNPAGTCVAGEDSTLVGGHETLSYKFASTGTYYVILDSFSPGSGGPWTATGVLTCAPDRIDSLGTAHVDVDLETPWGPERLVLNGPMTLASTVHDLTTGLGGTEGIPTELAQLELTGNSLDLGPVTLRLRPATSFPFQRSTGRIEETLNPTPGVLDLPPFTPGGTASFTLSAWLELEVPALKLLLHTAVNSSLFGIVHGMPAAAGDTLINQFVTPLADENGQGTAYSLGYTRLIPVPAAAADTLHDSRITLDLQGPLGLETVTLKGKAVAHAWLENIGDTDGNGLEQVPIDVADQTLTGVSQKYGPVSILASPLLIHPTFFTSGEIEENVNTETGRLDIPPFAGTGSASSFLDFYFSLAVNGSVYHSHVAKHLFATVSSVPPAAGEQYRSFVTTPLFDNSESIAPYQARRLFFTPVDVHPVGALVDSFPSTRLAMEVSGPWGFDELIFTGIAHTSADLGSLGDGDEDPLDEMTTRLRDMSVSSPGGVFGHIPGPVTLQLSDTLALGQVEESVNYTPGVLDLPPFTPVGIGSGSFASVQFDMLIPGFTALHLQQRATVTATTLHRVPAGLHDTYRGSGTIALLGPGETPSGMAVTALRLTPVSGGTVDAPPANPAPATLAIQDIRPNPAATNATVTLALPRHGTARLAAYDVNGRLVRTLWDGDMDAGIRAITWDGRTDRGDRAPGGIYFMRFESGNARAVKRLAILR